MEIESLEQKITTMTWNIVQQAIDCGDLDNSYRDDKNTIVFGFWSMHYGAILLDQLWTPVDEQLPENRPGTIPEYNMS